MKLYKLLTMFLVIIITFVIPIFSKIIKGDFPNSNTYIKAYNYYIEGRFVEASSVYHIHLNLYPVFHLNDIAKYYLSNCYKYMGDDSLARIYKINELSQIDPDSIHKEIILREFPKSSLDFEKFMKICESKNVFGKNNKVKHLHALQKEFINNLKKSGEMYGIEWERKLLNQVHNYIELNNLRFENEEIEREYKKILMKIRDEKNAQ